VTALAGGPPSAVGVQNRALVVCPSVPRGFSIMASMAGVIRRTPVTSACGLPGCPPAPIAPSTGLGAARRQFVVRAGKTLKGVVVWFGYDYS
jgi:hypothetical protein